ncbi:MAG: efflux RND transporter periplasmic adaptor subunit [Agarilytica sp.]
MKTIVTTTLTVLFLVCGPQLIASEEHKHDHAHENTTAHTGQHEDGDHKKHDGHTDHDDQHIHSDVEENHEHENDHDEENSSHINDDMARQVGIVTAVASAQTLHKTVTIYGSLASGPEQLSHVRARFEGMVKSVQVTIGDTVNAGDLLAEVESNESLKTYKMLAPISGLLVQRHANTGEVTQDQVLFSIANFDSLWAELRVYPAQQASINQGQPVHIFVNKQSVQATVNHVIPALDKPYQLARVKLDNSELKLSPGLLVEASVEIGKFPVSFAVSKNAIQTLGGREGVFAKHDENYEFTPLVLGKHDNHFVEVVDGLPANATYVSENSYLIKADIEKSEAEHDH